MRPPGTLILSTLVGTRRGDPPASSGENPHPNVAKNATLGWGTLDFDRSSDYG